MATMQEAIQRNQKRQARFRKAERLLRAMRQRVFDYEDYDAEHGTKRSEKCQRIMARCQRILAPLWEQERRNAKARQLEKTPSRFEPGLNHNG